MKVIKIRLNEDGLGTLECVGLGQYSCGAKAGMKYPTDVTISANDKKLSHYSREFDVELPYAILIWGQRGVYIHEWGQLPESAGCIHLLEGDAKRVYDFVDGKTRILISYPWK